MRYVCDLPNEHPDAAGWIYAFRSGDFIKVGMSRNVAKRLATVIDYNPHPVDVLLCRKTPWRVTKAVEQAIHGELTPLRHHGEWYRATVEDVLPVIMRHLKAAPALAKQRAESERRIARRVEENRYTPRQASLDYIAGSAS